jgi:hypothetical protein
MQGAAMLRLRRPRGLPWPSACARRSFLDPARCHRRLRRFGRPLAVRALAWRGRSSAVPPPAGRLGPLPGPPLTPTFTRKYDAFCLSLI